MYKVALVLSTVPSINVFRAALIGAFNSGHLDNFLICSGFFHERVSKKKGKFFASDAFLGAKLPRSCQVTVVGAYDPASKEFDAFVSKLSAGLKTAKGKPVIVQQRYSKKKYANKWHAKIFIARKGDRHLFAVIGSSNLTRNAFDSSVSNNEADVLIWDHSHPKTRDLAAIVLAGSTDSIQQDTGKPTARNSTQDPKPTPTVLVAKYFPDDPLNSESSTMDMRLKKIWEDVIAATDKK